MIICEKYNEKRLEEVACIIMAFYASNDKDRCITCEEVNPYANDIYYVYDTEVGNILAIIVGGFEDTNEDIIPYHMIFPIKLIYYDPTFLVDYSEDELDQALLWLVREFCADKNFWAIEYDIPEKQILTQEDPHIIRALRGNGFVHYKNDENRYLRVASTINYNGIYH